LLPKDLRFEHGGAKLVSCPRRHLTSLRPCTSRLSSQNGEICLQKDLPISGKLSVTNYLKQNAVLLSKSFDHKKWLEGRKKVYYCISKTSTTFPLLPKNAWVRVETNMAKNSKELRWHFALKGVYCITRALKIIRQYVSTSQRETWNLQWVND